MGIRGRLLGRATLLTHTGTRHSRCYRQHYKVTMGVKKGRAHHWHKAEKDKVPKTPYVPTGKPRGRPKKPPGERVSQPYVPTGKPRGRPKAGQVSSKPGPKSSKK